jgi:hypothetical protein
MSAETAFTPGQASRPALEASVDAAIRACGGDPRAAVRALIIVLRLLEDEMARIEPLVSRGYARRAARAEQRADD